MANVINFIQTNAADELISKVLTGKTLNFTRMAVGNGFSYDMNVAKGFKTLVNEVLSLDITKKETLSPKSVKITSAFKNTDAQKEFYYREVGLYAQDPDTGEEVLYAYGNRNDAAELITPAGSNVVTKQIVFIIAVGDSANVTFNVNADVYALQEDMLDVQANKANKNLSNTGMITNCLLEIPQRIKLELTTDGKLKIKAGSTVIIPFGIADLTTTYPIGSIFLKNNLKIIDTQYSNNKFFVRAEIQNDTDVGLSTTFTGQVMLCLRESSAWGNVPISNCYSGTTAPTQGMFYNTSTNMIDYYNDNVLIDATWALPLGIITVKDGIVTSIDQVFNGMGYIGSTVWVDKGIKGLIPNGRNSDDTLNNIEFVTSSLHIRDYSTSITVDTTVYLCFTNYYNRAVMLDYKVARSTFFGGEKPLGGQWWFDTDSNFWYFINSDEPNPHPWLNFAQATFTNGIITSFIPDKPFKAINGKSDRAWLSSLGMPSGKYIDYALGISGTNYTAPFNGWFAIRKVAGVATAGVSCAVYNPTVTTEIYRQTIKNSMATDEVAMIIPILKGQVLQVAYDATGETQYFRFIYAEGEAN